jgi:hypothetical protein
MAKIRIPTVRVYVREQGGMSKPDSVLPAKSGLRKIGYRVVTAALYCAVNEELIWLLKRLPAMSVTETETKMV